MAEAVAVAVAEAVEEPVAVEVALDEPDDVKKPVPEVLLDIEDNEEDLGDGKLEGLSDCFCAAEAELV